MQNSQPQEPTEDSRRRKGAFLAWGVAAALLALVGTAWAIPHIQDDLERTTRDRLEAAGIDAAHLDIDASGRVIRISNLEAGDDADAIRKVALDWGVRRVEIDEDGSGDGSGEDRNATNVTIEWDEAGAALSGQVHDDSAAEALIESTSETFGGTEVTEELEVAGGVTASPVLAPLAERLGRIHENIEAGKVSILGRRVTITGTPADPAQLADLATELEAVGANIDLVDPSAEVDGGLDGGEDSSDGLAAVYQVKWTPAGANIAGSVPTADDANQLAAAFGDQIPTDTSGLSVDDATGTAPTSPATGTAAIAAALPAIASLIPDGTLSVDGVSVTISGETSADSAASLASVITALEGAGLQVVDSTTAADSGAPTTTAPTTTPPTTAAPTTAPPTTTAAEAPLDAQSQAVENQLAAFVTANPIPFASGSASLLPESDSILTQIAGLLNQVPATNAVIEGHTDSQGNEAVNAELSSARAESVRAALVAKGVAADRLTAVGFGESQPIADNATTEGRAANRRVVFNLTKG